jgi:hypothetical protein
MADIRSWRDIEKEFDATLLLGNGASIAIDPCFSYPSLLESAQTSGYITPDLRSIFEDLRARDFELVLSMVRTAFHVNRALGIADARTQQAYQDIRTALVATMPIRGEAWYLVARRSRRALHTVGRAGATGRAGDRVLGDSVVGRDEPVDEVALRVGRARGDDDAAGADHQRSSSPPMRRGCEYDRSLAQRR